MLALDLPNTARQLDGLNGLASGLRTAVRDRLTRQAEALSEMPPTPEISPSPTRKAAPDDPKVLDKTTDRLTTAVQSFSRNYEIDTRERGRTSIQDRVTRWREERSSTRQAQTLTQKLARPEVALPAIAALVAAVVIAWSLSEGEPELIEPEGPADIDAPPPESTDPGAPAPPPVGPRDVPPAGRPNAPGPVANRRAPGSSTSWFPWLDNWLGNQNPEAAAPAPSGRSGPLNMSRLKTELERDEGFRSRVYRDTVGKLTVGIGRNLDDVGIRPVEQRALGITRQTVIRRGVTRPQAMHLLDHDVSTAIGDLRRRLPWFNQQDGVRQRVLINMAFNMGIGRLLGFRDTLRSFQQGNYSRAATQMLDSRWANQVGARATRLAALTRTGAGGPDENDPQIPTHTEMRISPQLKTEVYHAFERQVVDIEEDYPEEAAAPILVVVSAAPTEEDEAPRASPRSRLTPDMALAIWGNTVGA